MKLKRRTKQQRGPCSRQRESVCSPASCSWPPGIGEEPQHSLPLVVPRVYPASPWQGPGWATRERGATPWPPAACAAEPGAQARSPRDRGTLWKRDIHTAGLKGTADGGARGGAAGNRGTGLDASKPQQHRSPVENGVLLLPVSLGVSGAALREGDKTLGFPLQLRVCVQWVPRPPSQECLSGEGRKTEEGEGGKPGGSLHAHPSQTHFHPQPGHRPCSPAGHHWACVKLAEELLGLRLVPQWNRDQVLATAGPALSAARPQL